MESIKVLLLWHADDAAMKIIADVDPRVRVACIPYMEPDEVRDLRRQGQQAEVNARQVPIPEGLIDQLKVTDVLFGIDYPTDVIALAPRLKWVQSIGAGVDHLGSTGLLDSDVIITATGGFSSRSIAEFVLAFMLNHVKNMKTYVQAQTDKTWDRLVIDALAGKTVGIVGLGRIGSVTARLCKAFDMRVLATRRTSGPPPPYVDQLLAADGLGEMLPQCDFVVLSLALTPETRKIIGETELKTMKPTAFIVNVARGSVLDEAALVRALQEGWIGGAGLDVFEAEPLSQDSPLWEMSNVMITPHTAAAVGTYHLHAARAFAENLRRFIAGEPLLNIIDKQKGY